MQLLSHIAPAVLAILTLVAMGPMSPGLLAQIDIVVSLTSDNELSGQIVRDQDLVGHGAGEPATVSWPSETLSLFVGDIDGDGLFEELGDVDALHDAGSGPTAEAGLYLSLLSDQDGFSDGDVLRLSPGGTEVFLSEDAFVAAIGSVDGQIDIDAFHLDADGTILFSLAEDEESTTLSGDDAGKIRDGAILEWTATTISVLHTESEVELMVELALGAAVSIGDTKGISRDPSSGEILFSVQSPSAHDASVFSTAGGGVLLSGHEESDFGFTSAAEIDALSVAASQFASLTVSSGRPQAGEVLTVSLSGAEPGSLWIVLASLGLLDAPSLPLMGWGGLVLEQDALLGAMLNAAPWLVIVPNGMGDGNLVMPLGIALQPADVVVQAVAPGPLPKASNPLVLELGQ
jgi:hypothetical protein